MCVVATRRRTTVHSERLIAPRIEAAQCSAPILPDLLPAYWEVSMLVLHLSAYRRTFFTLGVPVSRSSFSLLFLTEMDISNSHLDVILPRMRYAEPAGGNPVRSSGSRNEDVTTAASAGSDAVNSGDRARAQDGHNVFPRSPFPPPPPPPRPAVPHPSIIALTGRAAGPPAAGYGRDGDRDGSMYDQPRFASTLKKLTAVATRLWSRWDLSKFPQLRTLEVSYAGRTMLQHLHRKVRK